MVETKNKTQAGPNPKASEKRVVINGRSRVVYVGSRNGEYVTEKGKFVPLKRAIETASKNAEKKEKEKKKENSKPNKKNRKQLVKKGGGFLGWFGSEQKVTVKEYSENNSFEISKGNYSIIITINIIINDRNVKSYGSVQFNTINEKSEAVQKNAIITNITRYVANGSEDPESPLIQLNQYTNNLKNELRNTKQVIYETKNNIMTITLTTNIDKHGGSQKMIITAEITP